MGCRPAPRPADGVGGAAGGGAKRGGVERGVESGGVERRVENGGVAGGGVAGCGIEAPPRTPSGPNVPPAKCPPPPEGADVAPGPASATAREPPLEAVAGGGAAAPAVACRGPACSSNLKRVWEAGGVQAGLPRPAGPGYCHWLAPGAAARGPCLAGAPPPPAPPPLAAGVT